MTFTAVSNRTRPAPAARVVNAGRCHRITLNAAAGALLPQWDTCILAIGQPNGSPPIVRLTKGNGGACDRKVTRKHWETTISVNRFVTDTFPAGSRFTVRTEGDAVYLTPIKGEDNEQLA